VKTKTFRLIGHLGEVHQSRQMLPICNIFIQLWATSNSLVQRWAI